MDGWCYAFGLSYDKGIEADPSGPKLIDPKISELNIVSVKEALFTESNADKRVLPLQLLRAF
jgi:hypothetical protein